MRIQDGRTESTELLSGPETAKLLLKAARAQATTEKVAKEVVRTDASGKTILRYKPAGKGRVAFTLATDTEVWRQEVLDTIESVLDQLSLLPKA
jgi:hypothetical protein